MGLDDFVDDRSGGGTARQYTNITRDEFESFLDDLEYEFTEAQSSRSAEIIYGHVICPVRTGKLVVCIASTITRGSGENRDVGEDAIRTFLYHTGAGEVVGGKTKTLRIKTWRKNLREKVIELIEETDPSLALCPRCDDGVMRRVDGEYGVFYGCHRYPDCQVTVSESDDGTWVGKADEEDYIAYGDTRFEAQKELYGEFNWGVNDYGNQ